MAQPTPMLLRLSAQAITDINRVDDVELMREITKAEISYRVALRKQCGGRYSWALKLLEIDQARCTLVFGKVDPGLRRFKHYDGTANNPTSRKGMEELVPNAFLSHDRALRAYHCLRPMFLWSYLRASDAGLKRMRCKEAQPDFYGWEDLPM